MPFDEENDSELPSVQSQKVGLKNVSSQKSIFDSMPKKPTQEDLNQKVKVIQERASHYKARAADLSTQFYKALADKTLVQNKNQFQVAMENDVLGQMVQLAIDINNDPAEEKDGMGSLSWIVVLLKTALKQRDKINQLEYQVSQLTAKADSNYLSNLISKEIEKALDKNKKSE